LYREGEEVSKFYGKSFFNGVVVEDGEDIIVDKTAEGDIVMTSGVSGTVLATSVVLQDNAVKFSGSYFYDKEMAQPITFPCTIQYNGTNQPVNIYGRVVRT